MNTTTKPKVSVICPTYNQEKYIRESLDGFISQKTDFDLEVIVADDCSTDKTPQIIEEYAKNHPAVIKPVIRKKNIGVGANFKETLQVARGKYIAICEGDDYWTDPEKLQLQADFLDSNPDYALCFHPVKVVFENSEQETSIYPDPQEKIKFTVESLLQKNYIQTNSVMYRRQSYEKMPVDILPIDWYLNLYHAQFGKIGFLDKTMSVYRRHSGGIWWDTHENKDRFWQKNGLAHLAMYKAVLQLYGDNKPHRLLVYKPIAEAMEACIELAVRNDENLLSLIKRFPDLVEGYMLIKYPTIADYNKRQRMHEETVTKLQHSLDSLQQVADLKDHKIRNLETELAEIKNSRAWHAVQKARLAKTKLQRKRK